MLKDGGTVSDLVEVKIHKLPGRGEQWDRKMKRNRSVDTMLIRPMDDDGDLKRAMHQKLSNGSRLQPCESQNFKSGYSNGAAGISKLDSPSLPASSDARGASSPRDLAAGLNKERIVARGSNKLNIPMAKRKGLRAPRTAPLVVSNLSSNFPHSVGALESSEQPPSVNQVQLMGGANNRKCFMPTRSSPPPMAQWVGMRSQKMSRTRRANLVSPVSNHDEVQASGGCTLTDFGTRIISSGTSESFHLRGVVNGAQQPKVRPENILSPARFSESEESGARENRLKEKAMGDGEFEERSVNGGANVGPSVLLTNDNKILVEEETRDGVLRQGRTGRGSTFISASIIPMRDTLQNPAPTKLLRNMRPSSDKNGSTSGHPLKKLSDRKAGRIPNSSSPDFTGDIDDDHEELFAAAKFACNSSYLACSTPFWKEMEHIFASVSLEDTSYLKHQLKCAEELHKSLFQMPGHGDNALGDNEPEISLPFPTLFSGEKERRLLNNVGSKGTARTMDLVNTFHDTAALSGTSSSKRMSNEVPSLYQRVLSALIGENVVKEFEENCRGRGASCNRDMVDFEYEESMSSFETLKQCTFDKSLCNDSSEQVFQVDDGYIRSEMHLDDELLLELRRVGIYPETVPSLEVEENDLIIQEINVLEKKICQQAGKRKEWLQKIHNDVQKAKEVEKRELEQIAVNKLIEIAYKKQLATRRGSRRRVKNVSKQVALDFAERSLARCRQFEDTGKSCFTVDHALRDVLFPVPSCIIDDGKLIDVKVASEIPPNNVRGRKKEVLLDDVGKITQSRKRQRKTKPKPKQETAQQQQLSSCSSDSNNKKRELMMNEPSLDLTNLQLHEVESIEELDVGGNQDLSTWLNFEDDGLQDHYSMGLEIPMDDLSEIL